MKKWPSIRAIVGRSIINPQFFILREEERAAETAAAKARGIVVDLGAGDQWYKDILLKKAQKYIPVDLSKPINKQISDHVQADINKTLPFNDSFCETVCLLQVLEYLENPRATFLECHRILKKNGHLVISTPFLYPVHDAPFDIGRYTKYALFVLLKKAGFTHIEIQKESSTFAFLINAINMIALRTLYHYIKKGGVTKVVGFICIPFVGSICILMNVLGVVGELFFSGPSAEFPLNYTIVARK